MHKEALYRFVLYTLLKEGKSNLLFKLEAIVLGKRYASIHFFFILYAGCDLPSFFHIRDMFESEYPDMLLGITVENIEKDELGLMTGKIKIARIPR